MQHRTNLMSDVWHLGDHRQPTAAYDTPITGHTTPEDNLTSDVWNLGDHFATRAAYDTPITVRTTPERRPQKLRWGEAPCGASPR